mmetsp:Transcript_69774/g.145507  ORF Transcript_69774/g.145507 Transcript_69774/m.145507 type:complete len:147 (+) Transcript_69774:556-996(+)
MGNFMGGGIFGTSAEKEFKRLTKKNTKANRDVVVTPGMKPDSPIATVPTMNRTGSSNSIRFGKLVTEVTYDHEAGEIEVVQETLVVPEDMVEEELQLGGGSPAGRSISPARRDTGNKTILRNTGSFNAGAYMRNGAPDSPLPQERL